MRPVGQLLPQAVTPEQFAEALAAVRNPGRCTRHHYVAVAAAAPTPRPPLEVGPRCGALHSRRVTPKIPRGNPGELPARVPAEPGIEPGVPASLTAGALLGPAAR